MRKNTSGFTLVELVVAIAASAIVVAAAASFLILGLRMEKGSSETAAAQSDSRVLMRVLENIVSEGSVGAIEYYEQPIADEDHYKWRMFDTDAEIAAGEEELYTILSFNATDKTINGKGDFAIIEDVENADISLENNLLTCVVTNTRGETYSASVYCRVGLGKVTIAEIDIDEKTSNVDEEIQDILKDLDGEIDETVLEAELYHRRAFLGIALSQYGSTGKINDSSSDFDGLYYSQWYKLDWGRGTPWCAIFASWCMDRTFNTFTYTKEGTQRLSSLVDSVMRYQFCREPSDLAFDAENNYEGNPETGDLYQQLGTWHYSQYVNTETGEKENFIPSPGDFVFFENTSGNGRADHMGIVLYVDGDYVFTIEGNHNDRVGIYSYPLIPSADATEYIIGYGVLFWENILPSSEYEKSQG